MQPNGTIVPKIYIYKTPRPNKNRLCAADWYTPPKEYLYGALVLYENMSGYGWKGGPSQVDGFLYQKAVYMNINN